MARREHVLSVFVASPSDVEAERAKLEDVIRELNVTWSRELDVRLDLVRWETHAYPGIGDDAQDVINEQVPDDYDLFVGIMWCRYGTPTGRAGSGTVEEFNRAKSRYDSHPEAVQLMVYFKDEPVPPSKLDPEQLLKVKRFRDSLGTEGVLYWPFNGVEQFEKLIRLHLARQVQAWKRREEKGSAVRLMSDEPLPARLEDHDDQDDEGLLDLIEIAEDRFAELTEIAERIGGATEDLGTKMRQRTEEITALQSNPSGTADVKEAKRLIARAASDMRQFTSRIEAEIPLFSDSMNSGMNSFIKAATMSGDLDEQRAGEGLDAVIKIRDTLANSRTHIAKFRGTIADLPRMTTDLNKAKRGAAAVLDELLAEFENGEVLLSESEKVISALIGNREPEGRK